MFTDQNWRSKMQGASAEIDARFGEAFTIAPTIRHPNYPPRPSKTNRPFKAWGVFGNRTEQVFAHDSLARSKGGAIVQSRKPILSFSHTAVPVALCPGDVVTRLADGSQYEVTAVEPDGVSRTTLLLVERGAPSQ